MMILRLAVAGGALALSSVLLFADDQKAPGPIATGDPSATYVCSASGSKYQLGEFACIPACHGQRRLARCDMTRDRASWTYVSESCPTAMINGPWPSAWSEIPAAAEMSPTPITVRLTAIPPNGKLVFAGFGDPGQKTE